MPRILLIQPEPGGRISGGYLYNAQMAAHGAWELCNLSPEQLAQAVPNLDAELVIADSIWLTERTFGPFLERAARGQRVAVMMHSFPSLIAAAEDTQTFGQPPSPFELAALERVGLVIAPGPHYAALLSGRKLQVQICAPGVPDGWRKPPRARQGPCRLVSVGAVTPRKGFLDGLEALRDAPRRNDFHWTIVGSMDADPTYAGAVAAAARDLGSVTLAGQQPPQATCAHVLHSDVLVMPSYDENHPLVVLEAMAASVPSVAYAAGAVRHMLQHGVEGLVCPIGERAMLAEHLGRLIDDEGLRYAMAVACFQHQRELPSWPCAARQARQALARLVPRH